MNNTRRDQLLALQAKLGIVADPKNPTRHLPVCTCTVCREERASETRPTWMAVAP